MGACGVPGGARVILGPRGHRSKAAAEVGVRGAPVLCQPSVSSGTTGFAELLPGTGSSHLSPGGTRAGSCGTSRLTTASGTFSIRKARALAVGIANLCANSLRRDVLSRAPRVPPSSKGTVLARLTACPSSGCSPGRAGDVGWGQHRLPLHTEQWGEGPRAPFPPSVYGAGLALRTRHCTVTPGPPWVSAAHCPCPWVHPAHVPSATELPTPGHRRAPGSGGCCCGVGVIWSALGSSTPALVPRGWARCWLHDGGSMAGRGAGAQGCWLRCTAPPASPGLPWHMRLCSTRSSTKCCKAPSWTQGTGLLVGGHAVGTHAPLARGEGRETRGEQA